MERINRLIRELEERQWLEQRTIADWRVHTSEYRLPGDYGPSEPFAGSEAFALFPSVQGTTYFFRTSVDIPAEWPASEVGLTFRSGGEGLLRVNGVSRQGVDRNHTYAALNPEKTGRRPELEIELYDPIPEPDDPLNKQAVIQPPIRAVAAMLVRANRPAQSLMYTATIVRDSALLLPVGDFRRVRMEEALLRAMDAFDALRPEDIREGSALHRIEEALSASVRSIGGNAEGRIHMVGQSHIDIAWLWPARETVRKASRTFSTVDALMDEYPDYRYAQSQPQLFQYLKDNDPELFARVKARVMEGRWELVGGMWVEPDLNIPSGESLMRQMLYGQRFYEQEFGLRSQIEWLPDTFGYCASLPQILKHGGMQYFMTTKLGWNDTNVFPYDLFHWVGIDGTPILSFMNHGNNENTLPKDIDAHWGSFREKAIHSEQMLLYGHGDGGGGVTREMLEYINRSDLMIGQPAAAYSSAADFFEGIRQASPNLPVWRGDLYLELHRGTFTTHARNKRSNRKAEMLYREAELWLALARSILPSHASARVGNDLQEGWKLILLNQFHDIIPGSSISEVYETSEKEYRQIFELGERSLRAAAEATVSGIGGEGEGRKFAVLNSLGWTRDMTVELPLDGQEGDLQAVYGENGERLDSEVLPDSARLRVRVPEVPAFGYRVVWLREAEGEAAETPQSRPDELGDTWETAYYRLRFNERGEIVSLFDKEARREVVKPGERANRFHFFHDRPVLWDAWDIDSRYEQQSAGEAELLEKKLISAGGICDVLGFKWRIGESVLEQELVLYHHDRRIDFKTRVEWNEAHKLLKVGFPIDVLTDKATYEIPFGAIGRPTHRNTSWEQAQYEVCGHRFADVSEHGYGVSLLNDCKYGYDTQGSTIRLSLLRAPKWPDRGADLGSHEFTYSLYPHRGDWREAHTLRKAAELNTAAVMVPCSGGEGSRPASASLLEFIGDHTVLDTVKVSEDGTGSVLRLYESAGGRETVRLRWPLPHAGVFQSNALEEELAPLSVEEGWLDLEFAPFEIKTIKILAITQQADGRPEE
ncbi:alpha-mannosidase [Gorillibacterium sp. sgz500922]|uniref:alpha-mannosidase n=1 Tax=Gorillibacterium sp. sgz500922 TaxID=3446694 RepID=UPI003F67DDF3